MQLMVMDLHIQNRLCVEEDEKAILYCQALLALLSLVRKSHNVVVVYHFIMIHLLVCLCCQTRGGTKT